MFAPIKQQFRSWISRQPIDIGSVTLTQRRIFILPTKQGFLFVVVLLLMLIGDINYSLSLGYILTFLLAMMALMSALHAFRNLAHLTIKVGHCDPVFAGETAFFTLHIHHALPRYHLCLKDERNKTIGFDLLDGEYHEIQFPVLTRKRGWIRLGRLTLYTRFPLGLFHAWSYLNFEVQTLVYPKPLTEATLPEQHSADQHGKQQITGDDDFAGLRKFVIGDMLTRIDWKVFAKQKGLLVKQFSSPVGDTVWLSLNDTPDADLETKLARLTRWVLDAEALGILYGLRLAGDELPAGRGMVHRDRCLQKIALFQLTS